MNEAFNQRKSAVYFSYKEVIQNSVSPFTNSETESKGKLVFSEEVAAKVDDLFTSLMNDNKEIFTVRIAS